MSNQLRDSITRYIADRFCGRRLMPGAWRDAYAEGLVYIALLADSPDAGWRPAREEEPWDLENGDGIPLQVKQSAALSPRSGSANPGKQQSISFDIHLEEKERQAHIFVFAWHPESAPEVADHRDADQWWFCVMPEDELPEPYLKQKTQRISLNRLKTLADAIGLEPIPYSSLAATINRIAKVILEADTEDGRLAEEALERVRRGEERTYSSEEIKTELGLDC